MIEKCHRLCKRCQFIRIEDDKILNAGVVIKYFISIAILFLDYVTIA